MVSIKTIANGLSKQIEQAIEGKADVAQADVLCKSVDQLVKLARLQIEMAQIDWAGSDEKPVIEMEMADGKLGGGNKGLTATALLADSKRIRSESDQTPPAPKMTFEQALKRSIVGCKSACSIPDLVYQMKAAYPEILGDREATVGQSVTYWAAKGHMEKIGSGPQATYKITDKEFFKP